MASELEKKLKRAVELLERASQDFKLKKATFEESCQLEALRELIKEQVPNENPLHTASEAR